jgi:hypothetical protein
MEEEKDIEYLGMPGSGTSELEAASSARGKIDHVDIDTQRQHRNLLQHQ